MLPLPRKAGGSLRSIRPLRCRGHPQIFGRAFSSSPRGLAVGPESPRFIEVPQPIQQRYPPKRRIKGTLPVPRNLFPRRNGYKKTMLEYLAATTPQSTGKDAAQPRSPEDPSQADYVAWKRRLAASRRHNLRSSLVELHDRHEKSARFVAARSKRRREEREQLVHEAEREDERLTSPTITKAMRQLQIGTPPDPDRAERIAAKEARHQAQAAARDEWRRDAAHTLYMHAREFITTEQHLNSVIDEVFTEQPEQWESNRMPGENIWNVDAPETVQQLLNKANKPERRGISMGNIEGATRITQQRIRKIAEELTGGKM
ncbi:MAG: hypothetical protein M1837_003792 [Sclerophora amabilis]|nr:MAG: hypothetical protein M1837_003792 [Sclerophora amabilis]